MEYMIKYTDRFGESCKRLSSKKFLGENVETILMEGGEISGISADGRVEKGSGIDERKLWIVMCRDKNGKFYKLSELGYFTDEEKAWDSYYEHHEEWMVEPCICHPYVPFTPD